MNWSVILGIVSMYGFALIIYVHFSRANKKTYRHRLYILNLIKTEIDSNPLVGTDLLTQFSAVTYDRHMWRILLFRDPIVPYPQQIQELYRNGSLDDSSKIRNDFI